MNIWDRTRQDTKFRQKLNNVKSTLPKINHPTTTTYNSTMRKKGNNDQTNYRKQNNLKH